MITASSLRAPTLTPRLAVLYTEPSRGTTDQTAKSRGTSPGTSFSLTSKLTSETALLFADVKCLEADVYLCRSCLIICHGWHVSMAARSRTKLGMIKSLGAKILKVSILVHQKSIICFIHLALFMCAKMLLCKLALCNVVFQASNRTHSRVGDDL